MEKYVPEFGSPAEDLCHFQAEAIGPGATETFYCHPPLMGVYITIQKNDGQRLTLCEVQAYELGKHSYDRVMNFPGSKAVHLTKFIILPYDRNITCTILFR